MKSPKHINRFIDEHCQYKKVLLKTQVKLKMMEVSFEQINNSRNDMIKQLAEQEIINDKLLENMK